MNTRTALWSEGLAPGDENTGTYRSAVDSVGGPDFTDGPNSTKRTEKSLGRNTFSRAGKEMFMGLRPLYDARIANAKEYDVIRDQLFRRGLAMAGSDTANSDIRKVGNANAEQATLQGSRARGVMGDQASGNASGLGLYFQDKAFESTADYTADRLSPETRWKQIMMSLGMTQNEISAMLDFSSAGELHGLTRDQNPESRNAKGGIGGMLGGIAGGLDWTSILGLGVGAATGGATFGAGFGVTSGFGGGF